MFTLKWNEMRVSKQPSGTLKLFFDCGFPESCVLFKSVHGRDCPFYFPPASYFMFIYFYCINFTSNSSSSQCALHERGFHQYVFLSISLISVRSPPLLCKLKIRYCTHPNTLQFPWFEYIALQQMNIYNACLIAIFRAFCIKSFLATTSYFRPHWN